MMWAKFMAFLGICTPVAPDEHALKRAMRRAEIASDQHTKIVDRARDSYLTIFQQQETDERPAEMQRGIQSLKETLAAVAERAGDKRW